MLTLAQPWLLLLLPLPLVIEKLLPASQTSRPALWAPWFARVSELLEQQGEHSTETAEVKRHDVLLRWLAWVLLLLALARPQLLEDPIEQVVPTRDLLLIVDLSGSMEANDFTNEAGDPTTSGEEALDEEALNAVASISGGRYFHANDREELESIYAEIDQLDTRETESTSFRPRRDLFHWPLAAMLLIGFGGHAMNLKRKDDDAR